jgi:Pentapeptide repeats (8 copies)
VRVEQRRWWVLGGVCLLLCVGAILAAYRFGWSGTGFLNKTVWDWLQLLIVPLVLAVAALLFQQANTRTERQIAYEKQQGDLLQAYLDRMSDLLLKESLLPSPSEAVRNVARVRTTTILCQLDGKRVGYVFSFLREAGLMSTQPNESIISLRDVDLTKVHWSQADLSKANLSGAKLYRANLSEALQLHLLTQQ